MMGMEPRVSTLFLDLNDDLTPCDDDPTAALVTGQLFGEKKEEMIELPIIDCEDHAVRGCDCRRTQVRTLASTRTVGSFKRGY